MNNFEYNRFFPYKSIRDSQKLAIDFALENFVNLGKKFIIIEAGTGVGKSAIGYTTARYLNSTPKIESKYSPGSYFLTTQKILQEQYVRDFGSSKFGMKSIKSSANYTCSYNKKNTCAESLRMLKLADKKSPFFR